jgi:glyoxylase-like metal-dependent hydrolase (beta-lactamase superfamily II)
MEILPNLHWLEGWSSNVYLSIDADGLTLVDTGMPGRLDAIFNYIERIGHRPTELVRILITHADLDHAGNAGDIYEQVQPVVYAGADTAVLLDAGKSPRHMPRPIQFLLDTFITYRPVPATAVRLIADGDLLPVLGGLRVVATPGHTWDHFSFFSHAHGVLFAGDALNTRGGVLQCSPRAITADWEAASASALRLLHLAPAIIACGHGRPLQSHTADDLMALARRLQKATPAGNREIHAFYH